METQRSEFTVGEIMRRFGDAYDRERPMFKEQRRALWALKSCRTAVLGGHLEECEDCGEQKQSYNSCLNRNCPTCGGIKARRWLREQLQDLLPVTYFHTVFTLPSGFNVLTSRNEKIIYGALFEAAWATIRSLAKRYWGAEPGGIAALHTWGQALPQHPHVHFIVTGGGLTPDGKEWVHSPSKDFLFDVHECSNEFRKRFCRLLRRRREKMIFKDKARPYRSKAAFEALISEQEARGWVVYTQPPAAGEAKVLAYLARYVHRTAISNNRIIKVTNEEVTFSYKDYADKDANGVPIHKTMTLPGTEFVARFMRHVLPSSFRRVRSYGLLAPNVKQEKLRRARRLLKAQEPNIEKILDALSVGGEKAKCPCCGGNRFRIVGELLPNFGREPPKLLKIAGDSAIFSLKVAN